MKRDHYFSPQLEGESLSCLNLQKITFFHSQFYMQQEGADELSECPDFRAFLRFKTTDPGAWLL